LQTVRRRDSETPSVRAAGVTTASTTCRCFRDMRPNAICTKRR
jgi:hypothetical protein